LYKVAIDARELSNNGGIATYILNLLRHIDERDMDLSLLVREEKTILDSKFNISKLYIPDFIYSNFTWTNFVIPKYLKENKIDLYHSPFFTLPLTKPCKMVVTIHDVIFNVNSSWFPLKNLLSFKLFTNIAVKMADKIITDSEASKHDLIKYYSINSNLIKVIPLAASSDFIPLGDRSVIDKTLTLFNIKKPFILYIGTLGNRKNIDRLILAFERLKLKSKIPHDLVLVGSPGYKGDKVLKMISKSKVSENIVHINSVDLHKMVCLYNAADIFVYPSLYEGFGLPVLEAFSCGTPVATSNTSSLKEISENAAILFNPEDINDIALQIEKVLSDKSLADSLIQKGLNRAKEFSWQKAAIETIQVYKEVLNAA